MPRPKVEGNPYDFSFSGLKPAVVNLLHKASQKGQTVPTADLAASVQKTISELLTTHTMQAAKDLGYQTIAVAGGVSAISGVRSALSAACENQGC